MENKSYKQLVNYFLDRVPENTNASGYLADLLGLSRESANRRIRGDIPFTVCEVLKLALHWNLSIDNAILEAKQEHNKIDPKSFEKKAYIRFFQSSIRQFYDLMLVKKPNSILMAINTFHPIFLVDFDILFKFSYYQNLVKNNAIPVNQTLAQTMVPIELSSLKEKIAEGMRELTQTDMVLDSEVFVHLIKLIKYYHKKKLITNEEKLQIKNDLHDLVDMYEGICRTNYYGTNRLSVYLSTYMSIASNRGVTQWDDSCTLVQFDAIPHVIINDAQVCLLQQTELDFLKRQSVGITQSNEIMQAEFFEEQHRQIDTLL